MEISKGKAGVVMKGTLVNLNVNPCKMCMPMGAVTAFYGIKKCMSILHGSQGCSTYIRRHMATHYNEPIDIASTSLTEEGTVYGGEQNLLKGLINLISIYNPEVIAVETTCLAETIGEDIYRIIDKFYRDNPQYKDIKIIPVPTAGYAGTQYEGFMKGLYSLVKELQMDVSPNGKVNVVTSMLSPADTRYIKEILESFAIDYILLPDLSQNLDGVYEPNYEKLQSKGTDIKEIMKMAGAKLTIEISGFTNENPSVAEYLYEKYQVPFYKCNLPVSLRDTDYFLQLLAEVSGTAIPENIKEERGRFLDAMVDAHKYNGEAKAVVYGEPDFVFSVVRLCVENGIMPLLVATGSKCPRLSQLLKEEIKEVADRYFYENYKVLDDVDFQTIEENARELGANILIGNSDGRRISEKLGIDLVRRSFPIHDRVGGQRLRILGYTGALTLLDDISNVIVARKETGFREEVYKKYYKKSKENVFVAGEKTIEEKTKTHPCFNCGAHNYARMHLPIAPKCNISCNYCVRKYDCPNESRPGVTTKVLDPMEAFHKYMEVKQKVPNLSVIGIAGPGDALANFDDVKKTLELIRNEDKNITFCLSTNGLMLPYYADELISLGVSHVTVTMNAVDPAIGGKIYKYINYMGKNYYGETAAAILLSNQLAGIRSLTKRGIVCKVNIVMLKGINDLHIPEVVNKVKELGGTITNIMQLIPVKGSIFEDLPLVSNQEIMAMRKTCGESMKQMYHCKQCRADAIGTLSQDLSIEFNACHNKELNEAEPLSDKVFQVAVATKSGMLVDQHFGQVSEFYVYEYLNGEAKFKERRAIEKYCNGLSECDNREDKFTSILKTIGDCHAVIAMRIGDNPKTQLLQKGIKVFTTYDRIEDSVKKVVKELQL